MVARSRVEIGLSYQPARLQAGVIDSLESIPGLLKSLKIPALALHAKRESSDDPVGCAHMIPPVLVSDTISLAEQPLLEAAMHGFE